MLVGFLLAIPITPQARASDDATVHEFLRSYLDVDSGEAASEATYRLAWVDLNGDGRPEAVVYLGGPWCGSGGCTTLILQRHGQAYRVRGDTTIVQLPIVVLNTQHSGWRDLAVGVAGGGIRAGYRARLTFNGTQYPGNPSIPPAHEIRVARRGHVVIKEDTAQQSFRPQPQHPNP